MRTEQSGGWLETLGVPSAFSWEPQGGWNLGSQEGPGEEDPVTALLTPVRGSAIQEIPQGKAGGGDFGIM